MIEKVTFIDIETVPKLKDWTDLKSGEDQALFSKRLASEVEKLPPFPTGIDYPENIVWREKAALYAEFNQIVAVSIGKMHGDKFFVKSLTGRDEKVLLEKVTESIAKAGNSILCAHNGKEFDFPVLMRKYMMQGLPVPGMLNVAGKKPWETTLEDTMVMWAGTAWNYKVSLELLASIFGLPNPKANMTGASVADIYYGLVKVEDDQLSFSQEETALRKIGSYCSTDVITCANVWCKMKGIPIIDPSIIVHT